MKKTNVWSLGWEDPPGEENSLQLPPEFCLENSMNRGSLGSHSMGSQKIRHDWVTNTFTFRNGRNSKKILITLNLPEMDSYHLWPHWNNYYWKNPPVVNWENVWNSCLQILDKKHKRVWSLRKEKYMRWPQQSLVCCLQALPRHQFEERKPR